jgi:putative DNA primase/helicase
LNSLGGEFGLAPLIGKPLAVFSDARFAGRDASIVVERLLSISGEDNLTVNRKYRDQWTGKLPTRLHVISNELPKLGDASTAIEDVSLEPALHAELAGILNWALGGLQRLTGTIIASPGSLLLMKPSPPCGIWPRRSAPSCVNSA